MHLAELYPQLEIDPVADAESPERLARHALHNHEISMQFLAVDFNMKDLRNRHRGRLPNQAMQFRLLPHHAMLVKDHSGPVVGRGDAQNERARYIGSIDKPGLVELPGGAAPQFEITLDAWASEKRADELFPGCVHAKRIENPSDSSTHEGRNVIPSYVRRRSAIQISLNFLSRPPDLKIPPSWQQQNPIRQTLPPRILVFGRPP